MVKVFHGNLDVSVEDFEFSGRLYAGAVVVSYMRHTDGSTITWEPELIRLVDVTDGEADWQDDDVLSTIPFRAELAQAVFSELDEYIADSCRDDCRFCLY